MPKVASDSLFELVHSLSGAEIRYLKLSVKNQSEDTLLLKLFNAIQKQSFFDDQLLFKTLKKDLPDKGDFLVKKNHLTVLILRVMRQYRYALNDVDTQLRKYSQDILFLLEKRLFNQALKLLSRAKKLARQNEMYHHLVHLLGYESYLLSQDDHYSMRISIRKQLLKESVEAHFLAQCLFEIDGITTDLRDFERGYIPSTSPEDYVRTLKNWLQSKPLEEFVTTKLTLARCVRFYIEQLIKIEEQTIYIKTGLPKESDKRLYFIQRSPYPLSLERVDFNSHFIECKEFLKRLAKERKLHILQFNGMFYAQFLYQFNDYAARTKNLVKKHQLCFTISTSAKAHKSIFNSNAIKPLLWTFLSYSVYARGSFVISSNNQTV